MNHTDLNPSEAKKRAGNYRKRKLRWNGLPISIENPAGGARSGTDKSGKKWSSVMPYDYGYIRGTTGRDGDHIDVFMGPHTRSELIVIINQVEPKTRKFDEHKCMLGFFTKDEAIRAYHAAYAPGWKGMGSATTMGLNQFKKWVRSGRKMAPVKFDVRNLPMEGRITNFSSTLKQEERKQRNVQTAVNTVGVVGSLGLGLYSYRTALKAGKVVDSVQDNIDSISRNAKSTAHSAARTARRADKASQRVVVNSHLIGKRLRASANPKNWTTGKLANRLIKGATRGRRKLFSARMGVTEFQGRGRPYRDTPDNLMGFPRDQSKAKGYHQQKYSKSIDVSVRHTGMKNSGYSDSIKGLNTPHALERAHRNWPDSAVRKTPKLSIRLRKSRLLRHLESIDSVTNFRARGEWDGKTGINPETNKFEDNRSFLRKAAPFAVGAGLTIAGGLAMRHRVRPKVPFQKGIHWAAGTSLEPTARKAARVAENAARGSVIREGKATARTASREAAKLAKKKVVKKSTRRRNIPPLTGGVRGTSRSMTANRTGVIELNLPNADHNNQYSGTLSYPGMMRKAQSTRKWAGRAGGAAQDVDDMVSGRARNPKKKRFYEKSWFKNALGAAAIAAPMYASRVAASQGYQSKLLKKYGGKIGSAINRQHGRNMPVFTAQLSRTLELSYLDSDETRGAGWDVRDARGKSARVFTPGSLPRNRREKKPHERVGSIRTQRNVAIGVGILGIGLGSYGLASRRSAIRGIMRKANKTPITPMAKVIKFPKRA